VQHKKLPSASHSEKDEHGGKYATEIEMKLAKFFHGHLVNWFFAPVALLEWVAFAVAAVMAGL